MSSILQLPEECLLLILARVDLQSLFSVSSTCHEMHQLIKDAELWRRLAEAKWGHCAVDLRAGRHTDWFTFCRHRICLRDIRRSPIALGQECFKDPWEHLICCLLCSRTSGSENIHAAVRRFLAAYPTPSALLDAPLGDVKALIVRPLGLADVRYKAVAGMSRTFLAEDWEDVQEFYGCGKFVSDSWRIFCRGELQLQGVEDVNLRRYLQWANTGATEDPTKPAAVKRKAAAKPPAAGMLRSGAKRKAEPQLPVRRSGRTKSVM